jgi:hypothetical protein
VNRQEDNQLSLGVKIRDEPEEFSWDKVLSSPVEQDFGLIIVLVKTDFRKDAYTEVSPFTMHIPFLCIVGMLSVR